MQPKKPVFTTRVKRSECKTHIDNTREVTSWAIALVKLARSSYFSWFFFSRFLLFLVLLIKIYTFNITGTVIKIIWKKKKYIPKIEIITKVVELYFLLPCRKRIVSLYENFWIYSGGEIFKNFTWTAFFFLFYTRLGLYF